MRSRPPSRAGVERRFSIERGAHPLGGHQLRLSRTSARYARKVEIECIDELCQPPNRSRRLPVAPLASWRQRREIFPLVAPFHRSYI